MKAPKPLAANQRLALGDVIGVIDTETENLNVYKARVVDFSLKFLRIAGSARAPALTAMPEHDVESLVKPDIPMSEEAVAFHASGGGYTDAMLEDKPGLANVASQAAKAILAASTAAGQQAGERRVWLFGMNSNSYDMRLLEFGMQRFGSQSWSGQLRESGVCGVIDLMTLVKKPIIEKLPTLSAAKVNGRSSEANIYRALFLEDLPDAHKAAGDVDGLIRIVKDSSEMTKVFLSSEVGTTLGAWKTHHGLLSARHEYEQQQKLKWRQQSSSSSSATAAVTVAAAVTETALPVPETVTPNDQTAAAGTSRSGRNRRPSQMLPSSFG